MPVGEDRFQCWWCRELVTAHEMLARWSAAFSLNCRPVYLVIPKSTIYFLFNLLCSLEESPYIDKQLEGRFSFSEQTMHTVCTMTHTRLLWCASYECIVPYITHTAQPLPFSIPTLHFQTKCGQMRGIYLIPMIHIVALSFATLMQGLRIYMVLFC